MKAEEREGYAEQIEILNNIIARIEEELFIKDLKEDNRNRQWIVGRSIYYMLARKLCLLPDVSVSKHLKKEHGTSLHGRRNFNHYMRDFPVFEKAYDNLCIHFGIANETQIGNVLRESKEEMMEQHLSQFKDSLNNADYNKHSELIDLILKVPEKHIGTMKTRLTPIVNMLPA